MGQEVSVVAILDDMFGSMSAKAKSLCFASMGAILAFGLLLLWIYSAGYFTGLPTSLKDDISRPKRQVFLFGKADVEYVDVNDTIYMDKADEINSKNLDFENATTPNVANALSDQNLACNEAHKSMVWYRDRFMILLYIGLVQGLCLILWVLCCCARIGCLGACCAPRAPAAVPTGTGNGRGIGGPQEFVLVRGGAP